MACSEKTTAFTPLNIMVFTISDTRTDDNDTSGQTLVDRAQAAGHNVVGKTIIPDEQPVIEASLREHGASPGTDVILLTGGTGVTARDVTPEAVHAVCDKIIPGFGELFRWQSFKHIATSTIQSRATAGVVNGTYVFAIPGSTGACRDAWDGILVHQLDIRVRPCNFAELIPRLMRD